MYSVYTEDQAKDIFNLCGYEIIGDFHYLNCHSLANIKDKNGYLYEKSLARFNRIIKTQSEISPFHDSNPFSIKNMQTWLSKNTHLTLLSTEYKGIRHRKYVFKCNDCNKTFEARWDAIVRGQHCIYCYFRKPEKTGSLLENFPELMDEWDFDKNMGRGMSEFFVKSNVKVWWLCKNCGHSYYSAISKRTVRKQGCPACGRRVVSDLNRLSVLYPLISSEWDYNKNIGSPEDYSFGVRIKVWWVCPICNISYERNIVDRTRGNHSCYYCGMSAGERAIFDLLKNENIKFDIEYHFDDLRSDLDEYLRYDFVVFVETTNKVAALIEYDHLQHEEFIPFFHKTIDNFNKAMQRDELKNIYASKNNIPMIRIDFRDNNIGNTLNNFLRENHIIL